MDMIVILFTFHFRALAARDESYSGVTFYYVHYRDTRCPCSKPRTNKQSMCDFNLHHAKAMKAMGYEEEEGRAAPAPAMKPKA